MKLRNLQIFVSVMEEGSLARAAELLNTSQPAASRLLRLLEEELGVALFERRKKRLIPTPEALHLLPEAHRILASVDGIPTFIAQLDDMQSAAFRVVCHMRVADSLVIPALAKLSKKLPDVRFHMEIQARRNLERLLMQEQFDVGVGVLPISADRLLRETLCDSDLDIFVSSGHPLAQAGVLNLNELEPFEYVGLPKHTVVRGVIDRSLDSIGSSLVPVHEFSNSGSAHHYVASTLSFTLSDSLAVSAPLRHNLARIPFQPKEHLRYGLFGKKNTSGHFADEAFLECLHEVIDEVKTYWDIS